MNPYLVLYIALGASIASTAVCAVLFVRAGARRRDAADKYEQVTQLAEATAAAVKAALRLASLPSPSAPAPRVVARGVEVVNAREFFEALAAVDLPTPGCGCDACDEKRIRRAADAERSGK